LAEPDSPLAVEVHSRVNVKDKDGVAGTNDSVADAEPFVDFVPGQLSPGPPPVATHVLAFDDFQVSVVDCPAVIVVGDAEIDTLTAGHVTATDTCPDVL
jgi:hypothetical protein